MYAGGAFHTSPDPVSNG
ncbi:TPA: hypothetical protein JDH29_004220 [Salmonella enterica subsp. houtenae]|nr:hypothetical protein [Salmonella enterica subsp. houtenae]